ncbi:putative toxin biosynthesis ketoreductase [Aspergillus ruber CBS 135680]|uniref:Putative toxin biosynthesis ketoreductase n=1 Tax=Aspergillus ruber (strain CBS 135680) TaxID=1388766 RepID=A0A017S4J4_ASPRC|nr:putative toxin biosynthesis ketoreductase [Aspergillus ruber CBS 135680]EYE91882.1 putative toxin biosynthesis ketoreductase [Aspergillus ruber CBS 135680]
MTQTVILITGANRGIRKALVITYLARTNTAVIATAREASSKNTQELRSLPAGPDSQLIIVILSLDIPSSISDTIPQILEHHIGHIGLVIANADICNHWGPVVDVEDSDLMSHFEVNALGILRLFRATTPLLLLSKQAKFVYISSELAISKAAGNYLVKKIDAEHTDIVALSIDPGFVQTDMGNRGAQCNGLERAPMTIAESVQRIIDQIDGATKSTIAGRFIKYSGDRLSW